MDEHQMNERLRELKDEALVWAIETLDPDALNENEWGIAVDEKFAELIVRECADLFEKIGSKSALNVLEHFGVEE